MLAAVVVAVGGVSLASARSASAPTNDNYADAQAISGAAGEVTGSNAEATPEESDPSHPGNGRTIWYSWTAPSSALVDFDGSASAISAFVQAYDAGSTPQGSGDRPDPSKVDFRPVAGDTYWILVDDVGDSAAGGAVDLRWTALEEAPAVTSQPQDATAPVGALVSFTAAASGTPEPAVQWQLSTDGGSSFTDVLGATATTLSVTVDASDDGNLYRAVFTNTAGSATSDAARLTVASAPVVTTQPANATAAPGGPVSFTAHASGEPAPSVQWQVSTNGGETFVDLDDATSDTYSFTAAAADDGKRYRAVFTNVAGSTQSDAAALAVEQPTLSIADAGSVTEPTTGTADASFTVSLDAASPVPVSVDYATQSGSAVAGSDFQDVGGTLDFAPGETTKTIDVPVLADDVNEFDESFDVVLSNAVNATIERAGGSATIVDSPAGAGPHAIVYSPGCMANKLPRNDDGSSSSISLPFTLNFFGTSRSSLYVNNNGNVTFDSQLSDYTPFDLTSTSRVIVAPFFADVDTRGPGSDVVTYGTTTFEGHAAFCVLWAHVGVGYYGEETDKLNSFQLLLVDRADTGATAGGDNFDIVFDYDQVQWETGDASGGADGLGGSSARVGYSNGSTSSFELPGSAVNGALLDSNPAGLIHSSHNSSQAGRYVFPVRSGVPEGGATVSGQVTDGTNPVAGAVVKACPAAGGDCTPAVSADDGGAYSISGLSVGDYTIEAAPPAGTTLRPGRTTVNVDSISVHGDVALGIPHGPGPGVSVEPATTGPAGIPLTDPHRPLTVTLAGCPNGTAAYTVTQDGSTLAEGSLAETPVGSGTYTGAVPPLGGATGLAQVGISVGCAPSRPAAAAAAPGDFDVFLLPGRVTDVDGTAGIAGATVTLLRSSDADSPFVAVPDGNQVLSAVNRTNPDTTTAQGGYGWDAAAGRYVVRAAKTGCVAADSSSPYAESDVVTVTDQSSLVSQLGGVDLRLRCGTAPVVTAQPQDVTAAPGSSAHFTAAATGDDPASTAPYTVRWQVSHDGGSTYADIDGATDPTLAVAVTDADDGNLYRAVFTNPSGSDTSAPARLTVREAPQVTSPASQTAVAGASARFTVEVSGYPAPDVQWQVKRVGDAAFVNIAGATTESYRVAAVTRGDNGNLYRAVATNVAGSATSDAAKLTVQAPAVPTTSEPTASPNVPPPPGADIHASASAAPSSVFAGDPTTLTFAVGNDGPAGATAVHASVDVGDGLSVANVSSSAGTCTRGTTIACDLGSLAAGSSATITVTATAGATGTLVASVSAGATERDPDGGNNSASVSVTSTLAPLPQPPDVPPPPPLLPPPVQGMLINAQPVTGEVLVDGQPFTSPAQLHVGAVVDVTHGSIELITGTDEAVFWGSVFVIGQSDNPATSTDLVLHGGDFSQCGTRTTSGRHVQAHVAKGDKSKVIRQLWGAGKGHFRTLGRYSAATVRGTIWLTQDRCDGSYTFVRRGLVAVDDFGLGHTIYVPAGYAYLAPAMG